MIEIRRCGETDVTALREFIDKHWRQDHVLAKSGALMDWQHKNGDGTYNYLLAWKDSELMGALGYIPSNRYDPDLAMDKVTWLSLWKVRDDCKMPGLGLKLLRALSTQEAGSIMAVNGINAAHPPMYKSMGYLTGELSQYYLLNKDQEQHLLKAPANFSLPYPSAGDATYSELSRTNFHDNRNPIDNSKVIPKKSFKFFLSRYLDHPFYRYRVVVLKNPAGTECLLALRVAEHNGSRALRIVDFTGSTKTLSRSGNVFERLMMEENAEYIDFWVHGLPPDELAAAGFALVNPAGEVTVPNYFEPFVQTNGRILFAIKAPESSAVVICRGDGDQDRPSILSE